MKREELVDDITAFIMSVEKTRPNNAMDSDIDASDLFK
jgi:hypothetical protein